MKGTSILCSSLNITLSPTDGDVKAYDIFSLKTDSPSLKVATGFPETLLGIAMKLIPNIPKTIIRIMVNIIFAIVNLIIDWKKVLGVVFWLKDG